MLTGLILAGGSSRRMGAPKATILVDGVPMLERVAAALAVVCDEVLVVGGDPAWATSCRARGVPDDDPGAGPLAALASGLAASSAEMNVAVGCDMPDLDPRVLRALVDAAPGFDAVVPEGPDGRRQPLHAVYRRGVLPVLRALLERSERRAGALGAEVVTLYAGASVWGRAGSGAVSWRSVNTPAELAARVAQSSSSGM